jgi:plastocyanin
MRKLLGNASRRVGLIVALGVPLLVAGRSAVAADAAPHDVLVTITDNGFSPGSVVIPAGGSVTWSNKGTNVHTATSLGGAPQAFNTGGFSGNQSVARTFSAPGTYSYTSSTDCLNGNNMPGFVCGTYSVTVVAPGSAVPSIPPPPVVPPTPQATAVPAPLPTVDVAVTDSGLSPAVVTVLVGGTVTWTNTGSQAHTATSGAGVPLAFDTGGLAPGQSGIVTFQIPGSYTYTSAIDCFSGAHSLGFDCGPYTVVVQTLTNPAG